MDLPAYKFLNELKQLPSIEKIILFGSRARGTARSRSDIDLAIALHPSPQLTQRWASVLDVIDNADTLLHIDCINLNELTSPALRHNIEKEGVVLFQAK
jgi:predicted nucleotidyltransferase